MHLRLCLYGGLQRIGGGRDHDVELSDDVRTVGALRATLARALPVLGPHLPTTAIALGDTVVGDDAPVRDGDEVGLLPPVSGG